MDSKKCIKLKHKLFNNVNIAYNVLNRTIVFWNKYQILLYDDVKYESLADTSKWSYITEFKIAQVILSSNYIICLDYSGNVYIYPLKFKQSTHKRIKNSFQLSEIGILCIDNYEDITFSIQNESNSLYFCIHKISSEFELQHKIEILKEDLQCPTNITCGEFVFCTYKLSETEFTFIKEVCDMKSEQWNDQIVVVVSFDNLTLYIFLISLKSLEKKSIRPMKLLACPSQINNVSFANDNNLNIIISLSSGTLMKLPLNCEYKTPIITHLNTAINKLIVLNDTIVYTDGVSMWKSENTFSKTDTVFRELTVRQVHDFIKVADEIICVTYSKLIYLISLDDERTYLDHSKHVYSSSEHLLNNCDYLYKIMDEIQKNDEIIKKIREEENYITTLALSNRKDIMDDVIDYKIIVYEHYEDIPNDEPLTLTSNIWEYFEIDSYYFLIKITTTYHLQQKFADILSNLFGNLKIHITLITDQKVLKTFSIKVKEQLKSMNIVIPLNIQMLNITKITVNIKLVTLIPGALNEKEILSTILHYKKILLNSEHFIKCNYSRNNIEFLKEQKKLIKDFIYETACNHHGHLFKINQISNTNNEIKWPFYVRLPNNYNDLLINRGYYNNNFNKAKANCLLTEISSEDFLKSKTTLSLIVANTKVEVEILNDVFNEPLLEVTSEDPQLALSIRNFFSDIINYTKNLGTMKFVDNNLYGSIENMEREIKDLQPSKASIEKFIFIFKEYQKITISML